MAYGLESEREPTHELEVYAKDLWHNAYLKGGSLIPQVRFGPHLPTLDAVLADMPDIDWQAVASSKLTEQQLKRSGLVMNSLHAGAGVDLYTRNLPLMIAPSENRRTITGEDLQREWSKTTTGLQYSIYGFLTDSQLSENSDAYDVITQMNALLQDPNNQAGLNKLRRVVDTGCKALTETRTLAELFRLAYSSPTVREKQHAEKAEIFAPYLDLYGLTQDMIEDPDTILEKILGRVKEAFIPFNEPRSQWLLYGTGLKLGE